MLMFMLTLNNTVYTYMLITCTP